MPEEDRGSHHGSCHGCFGGFDDNMIWIILILIIIFCCFCGHNEHSC